MEIPENENLDKVIDIVERFLTLINKKRWRTSYGVSNTSQNINS